MGKNLLQQRRGKGSPRYRSPSHRFPGKAIYALEEGKEATVTKIIDAPGKMLPLAELETDGKRWLHLPHEGIMVGQKISTAAEGNGNISKLGGIVEGTKIYNIEMRPGGGGRLCRSSGSFSTVIAKEGGQVIVMLPSGSKKAIPADCRATIGVAAGAGRKDKPFVKAGNKYHALKALGKRPVRVAGRSKNVVDHPFGGSNLGKHKTVSRYRSPGRKVGSISPKRTGKKK